MGKIKKRNFALGMTFKTSGTASKIVSNPFWGETRPVVKTNGPESKKALMIPFLIKEFPLDISFIVSRTFCELINGLRLKFPILYSNKYFFRFFLSIFDNSLKLRYSLKF